MDKPYDSVVCCTLYVRRALLHACAAASAGAAIRPVHGACARVHYTELGSKLGTRAQFSSVLKNDDAASRKVVAVCQPFRLDVGSAVIFCIIPIRVKKFRLNLVPK